MYITFQQSTDEIADGINQALYREHIAEVRHIYKQAYRLARMYPDTSEQQREFFRRFGRKYHYVLTLAYRSLYNRQHDTWVTRAYNAIWCIVHKRNRYYTNLLWAMALHEGKK